MSQSAAKFLLEFQATGDQEIVQKLRDIGSSGQEAATQLQELQTAGEDIGGSLTEIGSGAEEAAAPLEDMGAAAESAVTPLEDMSVAGEDMVSIFEGAGTATEDFGGALEGMGDSAGAVEGGLTGTNTMMGDFAIKADAGSKGAMGAGKSFGIMSGSMIGFAASANNAFQSVDNLIDAQYNVQRANIAAARATEGARKADVALDKVMQSATKNTAGVTAAREKLGQAMENLEKLQRAGVSSGAEYEATQKAISDAQLGLTDALIEGGVAADKAEGAVNGLVIGTQRATTAQEKARIAAEDWNESIVGVVINVGASIGTMLSTVLAASGKWGTVFGKMKSVGLDLASFLTRGGVPSVAAFGTALATLGRAAGPVGLAITAAYNTVIAFQTALKTAEGITAGFTGQMEVSATKFKESWDLGKMVQSLGPNIEQIGQIYKALGLDVDEAALKAIANGKAMDEQAAKTKTAASAASIMKDRMKELGLGMNDSMVATEGVSDSIASLNDPLTQAQITQEEFNKQMQEGNQRSVEFAQGAGFVTDQMGFMVSRGGQLSDIYKVLAGDTQLVIDATKGLNSILQTTDSSVKSTNQVVIKSGGAFVQVGDKIGELGTGLIDLGNGYSNVNGIIVKNTDILNKQGLSVEKVAEVIPPWNDMVRASAEAHAGLAAEVEASVTVITSITDALEKDTKAKIENAKNTLKLVGSEEQHANAIAVVFEKYAQSANRLSNLNAVKNDAVASSQALETALYDEMSSLIEEEMALNASIAALTDHNIQAQKVANAYLQGVESITEWNSELSTSAESERGAMDALQALGFEFEQLPGVIEPTIENIQKFGEANNNGGRAALEFARQVSDAYGEMLGEAGSAVSELADIFLKGGKDMDESVDKWFEDMPEKVRERLSATQIAALEAMGEFSSELQAMGQEFKFDWMTEGFDNARHDLISSLNGMKGDLQANFPGVFEVATDIASRGSEQTISEMVSILENTAGKPPAVILDELKALQGTIPPVGKQAGEALKGTLDPGAAEAGKSAAITLSEEFAAASTHIAAVMKGIQGNIDSLKQTKIPKLGVNIQNIMQNTKRSQQLINNVKQKAPPPRMGVNIQNIIQNTSRAQQLINNVKQRTIPRMGVNIQNALSNISRVQRAINSVRGRTVYINVVQRRVGPRLVATGFSGEVSQPTTFTAGEQGRERVTVEPISTANANTGGTRGGYGGLGGGAGDKPAMFRGDVILDGHKVGRVVGRLIAENNV
jgi:hypothetical protein